MRRRFIIVPMAVAAALLCSGVASAAGSYPADSGQDEDTLALHN